MSRACCCLLTTTGTDSLLGAGHASKAKRYFPFALGARDCLGRNLAAVSMSTTLATLLGRLSFSLADRVWLLALCSSDQLPETLQDALQYLC